MKIRIRFEKYGTIRYIGHLDIMRFFHKALQRAHIDISFSTGFHPHPIMSFASPLGVGLTSEGEYMDVEVASVFRGEDMLDAINEHMVEGIRVTGVRLLPDEGRKNNAMATVGQADYRVRVPALDEADLNWNEAIESFMAREEIPVTKKTKKSEQVINIRPFILAFDWEEESRSFLMRVTASSMDNLKPELLLDTFFQYLQLDLVGDRLSLAICRLDMRTADGTSLGELGEEIL